MKISVKSALALVCLTACNAKVSTPLRETPRVQIPSEPAHLVPYLAETGAEMTVLRHFVRTPLTFNSQGESVGDAAESYSWSKDAKQLKLVFPTTLKWSDGAPLTPCQYRAGILRMLGKGTGLPSPLSDLYRSLEGYDSALKGVFSQLESSLKCDATTLTLESTEPRDRNLLNALAFLGSAPWREDVGTEHRVSSGEFKLVEWRKGRSIKIEAVNSAKYLAPSFEFLFIRDADTALIMYEKGDLEILTEVPNAMIQKIRSRPDFRKTSMMATYYVAFALQGAKWVQDVRLRKALSLSAGREEIPSLLQGGERAAYTLTSDDLLPADQLASFRGTHREDAKEAKRLWNEVAQENSGILPKKISLGYSAGARHQLIMERLANNWKRYLGVEVSFEPQEWNHYIDVLKKAPPAVFRYAWTAVYPDPRFFLGLFESGTSNNFGKWTSKDYDGKLLSLRSLERQDPAFWTQVFEAEDLLVNRDVALIPLYHYTKVYMARGEVGRRLGFTYQGFVDLKRLTKAE